MLSCYDDMMIRSCIIRRMRGAQYGLKQLTVWNSKMDGQATEFRKNAATALRAGRKAVRTDDRDAHFEMAASYKALANDEERLSGARQRSDTRKKMPK